MKPWEVMDVIERGTCSLRRASILSNHLNGKARSWKIGLIASVLTKE
jgi:hypothetical protein